MNNNLTYEQDLNLKDLIFAVLYKWRIIIVAAIVFALALGGFKGVTTYKSRSNPEKALSIQEAYNADMDTYARNKASYEREIANIERSLAEQVEYLENSIWVNLSPYDINEAKADLYVTTGYEIMPGMTYQNIDYTDDILSVYQSMLVGDAVIEAIAAELGTEARYIREIISIEQGEIAERANHVFTVRVKHNTTEEAQQVLDSVLAQIDGLKHQVETAMGEHTVRVVNSDVNVLVDLDHAAVRTAQEKKTTELEKSLTTKRTALEALKEPVKPNSAAMVAVKSGIKFAILGGVGGACIVAFMVCVFFLMNTTVYSARELKNRYQMKILGVLSSGKKKMCVIDTYLRKMEGRAQTCDEKTSYSLIAANIHNYIGEMQTILVTGNAAEERIQEVASKIAAELSDIQVVYDGSIMKNASALEKLPKCDSVVLVEQCGVSGYGDIEQEIEKISDLEKRLVGCVVID